MNSTLELPAARGTQPAQPLTSTSWEYRFIVQDEWGEMGSEITDAATEGWVVVAYGVRRDNRREYVLRRPRR